MRTKISTIALAFTLLALTPSAHAQSPGSSSPATIPAPSPAPDAAKKHAKHVYTDDDFSSPSSADVLPAGMVPAFNVVEKNFLTTEPMTAQQLDKLMAYVLPQVANNRAQTKVNIAQLYLRDDNVPFTGRDDWDRRMFDIWTDLWKSMDDFSRKLQSIRNQDAPILSKSQPTDRDLSQLRDDRKALIEAWEPTRKLVDRFAVLKREASEKAAEWRQANPPGTRTK
jgi:hypothetical protein